MDYPERVKHILKNFEGEERQKKCAEWLLEENPYNDLKPWRCPQETPEVAEHYRISKENRAKLRSEYFDNNPEILKYKDSLLKAYFHNKKKIRIFKEFQALLQDEQSFLKYKAKIAEFEQEVDSAAVKLELKQPDYEGFVGKVQRAFN